MTAVTEAVGRVRKVIQVEVPTVIVKLSAFWDLICFLLSFRLLPLSSAYGCRRTSLCHPLHPADSEVWIRDCLVHIKRIQSEMMYCVSGSSNRWPSNRLITADKGWGWDCTCIVYIVNIIINVDPLCTNMQLH